MSECSDRTTVDLCCRPLKTRSHRGRVHPTRCATRRGQRTGLALSDFDIPVQRPVFDGGQGREVPGMVVQAIEVDVMDLVILGDAYGISEKHVSRIDPDLPMQVVLSGRVR